MKIVLKIVLMALFVFLFRAVIHPVVNINFFSFWAFAGVTIVAAWVIFYSEISEESKIGKTLFTMSFLSSSVAVLFFGYLCLSGFESCNKKAYAEIGIAPKISIIGDSLPEKKIEQLSTLSNRDQAERIMAKTVNSFVKLAYEFEYTSEVTFKGRGFYIALVVPKNIVPFTDWVSNKEAFGYAMVDKITLQVFFVNKDLKGRELHIQYLERNWFSKNVSNQAYWKSGSEFELTDFTLEIDDELGRPYLTPSRLEHTIGFWGAKNVGVSLFDLQTGELTNFDIGKAPSWVDAVLDPCTEFNNINYRGLYGFRFGLDSSAYECPRYDVIPGRNEENLFYFPIKRRGTFVGYILQSSTMGEKRFYQFANGMIAHDETELVDFMNDDKAAPKVTGKVDDLDPVVINGMPVFYGVARSDDGAPTGYVFAPIFQIGNKNDKFTGFGSQMRLAYDDFMKEYQKQLLDSGLSGNNIISNQSATRVGVVSATQPFNGNLLVWFAGVRDTVYEVRIQNPKGVPQAGDTITVSVFFPDLASNRKIMVNDYNIGFRK